MFISTLEGPPFRSELEDHPDEDGRLILTELAQEPESARVCSVKMSLCRAIFDGSEVWEFAFSIVVVALDDGFEAIETQDREIAKNYIPDSIRHLVMDVVVEAMIALVEDIDAEDIFWVTKDIDPPEKALQKHYILREALDKCGYRVAQQGTDEFRRCFWVMNRDGD